MNNNPLYEIHFDFWYCYNNSLVIYEARISDYEAQENYSADCI